MMIFNPNRLTFARQRRGFKKIELAQRIHVTREAISGYETGKITPDKERLIQMAEILQFPPEFFYEEENIDCIEPNAVSFRALTKMSVSLRDKALSAGAIAVLLNQWIEARFTLPVPDVPSFGRDLSPEAAADSLRRSWGIGESAIRNMVHLLELKGVKVFSLALETRALDAFSMWRNGTPFIFLNTRKSAEHSRFDAAHELGHLVMHQHGAPQGREAEKEADAFASAFLMPSRSMYSAQIRFPTLDGLIQAKKRWGVSVSALNYRLHTLGITTEWIYRSLCIEIAKAGYRTQEPERRERETSQILEKIFRALRAEGIRKTDMARALRLLPQELDECTYGLLRLSAVPSHDLNIIFPSKRERPALSLVT